MGTFNKFSITKIVSQMLQEDGRLVDTSWNLGFMLKSSPGKFRTQIRCSFSNILMTRVLMTSTAVFVAREKMDMTIKVSIRAAMKTLSHFEHLLCVVLCMYYMLCVFLFKHLFTYVRVYLIADRTIGL